MAGKALTSLNQLKIDQVTEVWVEISNQPGAYIKALSVSGDKLERIVGHDEARQFALMLGETGKFDFKLIDWISPFMQVFMADVGGAMPVKRLVFWPKGQPAPWDREIVKEIAEGETTVITKQVGIISIQGRLTKSGSVYWNCQTDSGDQVNVFEHNHDRRDQTPMFTSAGYNLSEVGVGSKQFWRGHPIEVTLKQDGQYWLVIGVEPRYRDDPDRNPDPVYVPDYKLIKEYVTDQAASFVIQHDVVFWDTETTGTAWDDEIIQIGGKILSGTDRPGESFCQLIKPRHIDRVATTSHITGITADMLENAPSFPEVYPQIKDWLDKQHWAGYNIPFDVAMLFNNCLLNGLPPLSTNGVMDVCILFSQYYGEWDADRMDYRKKGQGLAIQAFNEIEEGTAHNAQHDAEYSYRVAMWLAEGREVHTVEEKEDGQKPF